MALQNKKIKRLKGKTKFDEIFKDSAVFKSSHLTLRFIEKEKTKHLEVGVVVSKKLFKRSVDRNKIKRLIREGVCKNKQSITFSGYCVFLYKGLQVPVLSTLIKEINSLIRKI